MTLSKYPLCGISFLLFFSFFAPAFAQQSLQPLEINVPLHQHYLQQQEAQQEVRRNKAGEKADTIQVDLLASKVIFRDDFSGYSGWPDKQRWADQEVYVNASFGYETLTLGVATFDGLDSAGYPYEFSSPSSHGENDHLTSLPMDLSSIDLTDPDIDSVFLSFYYQPQGMNPFPTEPGDSLILEFYDPVTSFWSLVWSVDGMARKPFEKVTLFVEEKYYEEGFQFRFTNFGGQAGSLDHWNIDYVYMSSNPEAEHEVLEDMAFRSPVNSLLNLYTAMPWWHYQPSDMLNEVNLRYYYFNTTKLKSPDVKSWLQVLDASGNEVFSTATDNPEFTTGFLRARTINWQFNASGVNVFPTTPVKDVTFFTYKFYYSFNDFTADSNRFNDTIVQRQVFGNFYAYDDGIPEAGFGLYGYGNKLAYGFDLGSRTDTLKALYIYFNPVVHNRSKERFRLAVWRVNDQDTSLPGAPLFINDRVDRPVYTDLNKFREMANFARYEFEEEVIVSGKIFVGWVKLSDNRMNVGYDVSRNFQDRIFIDVGAGWEMSDSSGGVVPGCLMIRPVFGDMPEPVVGVKEQEKQNDITVYPNPAGDRFYVEMANAGEAVFEVQLIDVNGSILLQQNSRARQAIDVSSLPPGLYFVKISGSRTGDRVVRKLLISR